MHNNSKSAVLTSHALIKRVAKYKNVSFDVFDTLIKRNVQTPSEIFKIVNQRYNLANPTTSLNNFDQVRTEAEQKAYSKYGMATTLENIYSQMSFQQHINVKQLATLEIQVEMEYCVPNLKFLECFNWCLDNHKNVYVISDMYLSSEIIRSILSNAGYRINEATLYVSNECNSDKRSGKLFELVEQKENITESILHIGDSIRGDFLGAKKSKWKALLIPKNENNTIWGEMGKSSNLSTDIINSFINNNVVEDENVYHRFGFEVFGQLLTGFCNWLYVNTKKNHQHDVFFVSRDGYQLKKVFDLLYGNDKSIQTHYLHASRKSLQVALLWNFKTFDEILENISLPSEFTPSDFLKALGLSNQAENVDLLNQNIFNHNLFENAVLENLYNEHKDEIRNNSRQQFTYLKSYLENLGFDDGATIVDIGWRGSMQNQLNLIQDFRNKTKVYGYYFGLSEESQKYHLNAQAYVFDGHRLAAQDVIRPFQGLFEMCLSAPEGTTLAYQKREGKSEPKLAKYELSGSQAQYLSELRAGALEFANKFHDQLQQDVTIDQSLAFRKFQSVGLKPTKRDLSMFSNLKFSDHQLKRLAAPANMVTYIHNPQKIKGDLLASRWKIAFFYRLFRIPLPYSKIYQTLFNWRSEHKDR